MEAGEEGETHLPLYGMRIDIRCCCDDRSNKVRKETERGRGEEEGGGGGGGGGGEGKAATRQPISCHYIYTFGD